VFFRSPSSRSNRRSFRPHLETLENRVVPTTTAGVSGPYLEVDGNNANHTITITELATSGSYRVSAADLAGGSKVFQNVQGIEVYPGGGNDTVNLKGIGAPALPYNVYIDGTPAVSR
jgi:hypothetical protein